MSDLKLVYRTLRKISEWALEFYSEVYVTGQQNIPVHGPILLISCHHNEIIDIATLSATIPFRRPVCFWAKSTLFRNPIMRSILLSSGSIPVRRSATVDTAAANISSPHDAKGDDRVTSRARDSHLSLFRETFQAFDAGEVIGLFPEGTSYTEPQIVQVKDGAAWASLEYARWQLQHDQGEDIKPGATAKKLVVIPVGIVYTDKSRYQSRVRVEFGEPIDIDPYTRRYLAADRAQDPRSVIKDLTVEIEKCLRRLTINAPNWETWFAARIARDIIWNGDSNIPIQSYTNVSQVFIDRLSAPSIPENARKKLIDYYALLQHTGITHDTLASILPSSRDSYRLVPTRFTVLSLFLRHLLRTALHPSAILFLPPLILHLPVFVASRLGERLLASANEEETKAQFKAVCGGVVYGILGALTGVRVAKTLFSSSYMQSLVSSLPLRIRSNIFENSKTGRMLGTMVVVYCTIWGLFRWYNQFVRGNYTRFNRLQVAWKLLVGLLSPPSQDIAEDALGTYTRPSLPARNPYIKRRLPIESDGSVEGETPHEAAKQPTVAWRRLIRPLLKARAQAEEAVHELGFSEMRWDSR